MDFSDHLYWFVRNLAAFLLMLIFVPVFALCDLWVALITVFNTDGSEVLAWPWDAWRGGME